MKKIFSLLASVCLILLTLPVGFTEVHAATVQNNYSENSANNGSGSFRTVKARAGINVASDDSVFSSGNQAANEMSIPKKEIIPGDRLGLLLTADINSNVNGSGDKLTLSAVLDKRITLDENSVITVNQNGDDRQVTLPWNDVTYDKANNTFSVEITPNTLGGPNLSGTIGVTVYAKSDTTIPEGYTTLPINLTAIYTNPDSQVYRSGVTSMYYEKGKAQINVHDSTIKVGDVWNEEDNFDSAVDGYGKLVALSNIQVDESQVETNRVGVFEVPYMYDGITSVAKVTVVNNAQDVTVRYVGGEGKELATSDTLSGNIGDAYTSAAKTIDGWKLKETPENATGTFSDTAQTVTYVYEKAAVAGRDVTVRYVDGAGKELATSDILSGNVGDTYTSIAKDIEGWKLKETPENATGTFSDTAQTVTYVYEKAAVAGQDVTVRYVDGAGKELATSDILSGNVGDIYTSTAKVIDGWKLKKTPTNATGTISDTAQTVTYVYEKAAVAGQDVTVRYVDGAGKELATSDILSGNVGDTYTSIAKDIEGWNLKAMPANATGTFSDSAQTVTYVYEKNTDDIIPLPLPEEPTTPSDDKITDGKSNVTPTGKMSIQPTVTKEPTKQAKEKSSLPKTGDSTQNSGILGGVALLLFGIALFMRRPTRKNK